MDISLLNRHALVCGASRGIGAAIASALAKLGATVTLLARDTQALERVASELNTEHGQQHRTLIADMLDTVSLQTSIQSVDASIDILVNNSGGPAPGPIANATESQLLHAFKQHVIANQTIVQHLLPQMSASGTGRVINIISTSVRQPIAGLGVSNTIRGAVASWSKTLATELGPKNITVNNVLPGYTNTERLQSILKTRAKKNQTTLENAEAAAVAEVPLGRFAEPQEIANAVAFLAGPAAAYITGTNILVDGGRTSSL